MADDDTTTAASTADLNDDDVDDICDEFYTSTPKKSSNKHESADNNNDLLIMSDHQRRKAFKNSPSPINTQAKPRKRPTIVRFRNETKSNKGNMVNTQGNTDNNLLRPTMSAVTRSTEALDNRLHESGMKRDSTTSTIPDDAGDLNSDSSNEQKSHVCMISLHTHFSSLFPVLTHSFI